MLGENSKDNHLIDLLESFPLQSLLAKTLFSSGARDKAKVTYFHV